MLEGSTNGGKYLARVLRKAWQDDGESLHYLDPYGDEQPERWASFKRIMDASDFSDEQCRTIIDAARRTIRLAR